jgi:ribosomal protein S18 acetylase RimI-like enzyme
MVSIRAATEEDRGALEKLVDALFPGSILAFGADEVYFLAEHGGRMVGFSRLKMSGHRGVVAGLGVLAPYRKRGIGTLLLQATLAYCEQSGCTDVMLKVRPENLATEIYARHGFMVRRTDAEGLLLCRPQNS